MKALIVSKRYAEAYIAIAREEKKMPEAIEDFKNLKIILYENPQALDFLKNPGITYLEKSDFINAVFGKGFNDEFRHFLKYLIEKRRIDLVVDIADYVRVRYAHGEAVNVVLKTSYPLDLDLIKTIKERLENKYAKKFNLYLELDANLNGGIQIMIGNMMIDGSIKRRLDELREKLMAITF